MTLIEVILSLLVATVGMGGMIQGYILAAKRVDWTVKSAAAQASAINGYERTMAATWTVNSLNLSDQLVAGNFPPQPVQLAVADTGSAPATATNFTTITQFTTTPPLRLVRVDCIWRTQGKVYTNSMMAFRAPSM